MAKKTIRDISLSGRRVLVRVDFNVPLTDGEVADDFRIKSALPTILYLLEHNCRVVLISHLGRPDGRDTKLSLKPVAVRLAKLLKQEVVFAADCVGEVAETAVQKLEPGGVVLLENLRFHPEEKANDATFAKQLASLAEIFVDDAFAAMHRAHASTVGVAGDLPAVAGFLAEREVKEITHVMEHPKRPVVAIIGGAKISTKIELLDNLLAKVEVLAIGGAMANTFLAAQGYEVGRSVYEPDQVTTASRIMRAADERGVNLILPTDVITTDRLDAQGRAHHKPPLDVTKSEMIADVGPKTVDQIAAPVALASTVIWNGPLGLAEFSQFAQSSIKLAKIIARAPAYSLIGGGDTASFLRHHHLEKDFNFISTGGGATLELLSGKKLPGWEVLQDK